MQISLPKQTQKSKRVLTIILIFISLALGFAIYQQSLSKQSTTQSQSSPLSSPTPINYSPASSSLKSPILLPSDLSEDEKAVLNPPSPDASAAEKDKHDALATKLSKETESLDITNCRSNPLVLRIKINKNLKVKNSDNIDRKLIFDDTHKYQFPKNATTNLKIDFGHGAGLYGYICEGVGLTGFILVTP